ncbi:GNAT family N-acetyltransferase [Aestuariimicrobium ganziense]|uniref:GNAT family N-acetyltransferase n=1 Tax=Aestuariimicrobium ganziense TaxID=2773677 RepID=UPI001943C9E1|nr:GNAT family N-acetyltransferase [Aestuariimicrobium ganziense]
MAPEIRPLTPDDAEASRRLGWEAFGLPAKLPKKPAVLETAGHTWLGAFEGGQLLGRLVGLEHESAFGGVFLPSVGIAGVTVGNEHRSAGLLRPLFTALLSDARAHGVAVSTLYPSAPGIYRGAGYEAIATSGQATLPTSALARLRVPAGITLRRAGNDDVTGVHELYHEWALAQNGPLAHRGVLYETKPSKWLKEFTGVTLAEDGDGVLQGYLAWHRGDASDSRLDIEEFHWRTPDAATALLAMLATNAPVTGSVRFATSGNDPLRLVLPSAHWTVEHHAPYMLKVVDLRAALTERLWPEGVDVELPFRVVDDLLEANNGDWKLRIEDGHPWLTRIGKTGSHPSRVVPLEMGSRGLAALYAGAQTATSLRTAGLVWGGDPARDLTWSVAFGGRAVHIRDTF